MNENETKIWRKCSQFGLFQPERRGFELMLLSHTDKCDTDT